MKTCGTLFSGGGLADVGLKAAGYTPVLAVEYDPKIAEVYALNHGPHVHVCGVEAMDYRPYAGLDLLWASPVCVNASVAKADGKEEPEDLSAASAVVRALQEIRPQRFLLENVGGYARFESFRLIVKALWALGYRTAYEVLNAASFGVPQTRRRLILRAVQQTAPLFRLTRTHRGDPEEEGGFFGEDLPRWNGWYAAIEDLIPDLPESKFAEWQIKRLGERFETQLVGGANTSDTQAAPGVGVSYRMEPTRVDYASQALTWRAWLVDGKNANREITAINSERPAFSLIKDSHRRMKGWLENGRVKAMTPRALARFQSIPDSYRLPSSSALASKVIGNGVPSLLAQKVAESLG